jgi:hypothetical protein
MREWDVVVIGGGAAGLMCAFVAGARGRRVLLLEHNARVGRKIEISGGGRCNFTNVHASPDQYLSTAPAFCRSALARFTPSNFLDLIHQHGIAYHEKKLGQLFCNSSSRAIIGMLVAECHAAGVVIRCGVRVSGVSKADRFRIETQQETFACESLVVATGGLSFPKLGASDLGYRVAEQFGLEITPLRPGLVPLAWGAGERDIYGKLSGLSLPVETTCGKAAFLESLLFTHRGVSGPAVLQISSYWDGQAPIAINLLPGEDFRPVGGELLVSQLSRHWPRRFAEVWCDLHAPARPPSQWSRAEQEALRRNLHKWTPPFATTEGYAKAEVTLGGVATKALSSKTMEARDVRGLFFVGEVVDVTGWLGGYNFQWAWASGHAAGSVV